jgi:hypothetical protein
VDSSFPLCRRSVRIFPERRCSYLPQVSGPDIRVGEDSILGGAQHRYVDLLHVRIALDSCCYHLQKKPCGQPIEAHDVEFCMGIGIAPGRAHVELAAAAAAA